MEGQEIKFSLSTRTRSRCWEFADRSWKTETELNKAQCNLEVYILENGWEEIRSDEDSQYGEYCKVYAKKI